MTIPAVIAWIQLGQQLVAAGSVTVATIRSWIATAHAGTSDADLNAICDAISSGAARHKALAQADAS